MLFISKQDWKTELSFSGICSDLITAQHIVIWRCHHGRIVTSLLLLFLLASTLQFQLNFSQYCTLLPYSFDTFVLGRQGDTLQRAKAHRVFPVVSCSNSWVTYLISWYKVSYNVLYCYIWSLVAYLSLTASYIDLSFCGNRKVTWSNFVIVGYCPDVCMSQYLLKHLVDESKLCDCRLQ